MARLPCADRGWPRETVRGTTTSAPRHRRPVTTRGRSETPVVTARGTQGSVLVVWHRRVGPGRDRVHLSPRQRRARAAPPDRSPRGPRHRRALRRRPARLLDLHGCRSLRRRRRRGPGADAAPGSRGCGLRRRSGGPPRVPAAPDHGASAMGTAAGLDGRRGQRRLAGARRGLGGRGCSSRCRPAMRGRRVVRSGRADPRAPGPSSPPNAPAPRAGLGRGHRGPDRGSRMSW